jgi:hypothetical protein
LDLLIKITTALGDLVFAALGFLSPVAAMIVLSGIVGAVMLVVWRFTSNQSAIADVRKQIAANLLATRLFKDNLSVTFRAQRQIIWQALRLLGHAIRPTLIMLVPFTLIMSQIGLHYEFRPAPVGKPIGVTAKVKPGQSVEGAADKLQLPEGLTCNSRDPCRAEALGTIDWRITPSCSGIFTLKFGDAVQPITLALHAGDDFVRISSIRGGPWLDRLLYSAEPAIPADSIFDSITIHYPTRTTPIFGVHVHWLITLLILSILFALILKPILKVHM